jgi:outer membrane biosynthesis protein TonB
MPLRTHYLVLLSCILIVPGCNKETSKKSEDLQSENAQLKSQLSAMEERLGNIEKQETPEAITEAPPAEAVKSDSPDDENAETGPVEAEPKTEPIEEKIEPQKPSPKAKKPKPAAGKDVKVEKRRSKKVAQKSEILAALKLNESTGLHSSLGYKGTAGPIHGVGKISTGGGTGMHASLGKKSRRRAGKIRIGSGRSSGFCKKSDLARKIRRRAGAIRACYERRLQVNPRIQGKVNVRFTVGASGAVQSASASGSLSDGAVRSCIVRTIRRIRFAKPEGGVCVVQWPFVFNSGG